MKLEIWSYSRETYERMHAEGERRFGSDCKHASTQAGVCQKCLRKVKTNGQEAGTRIQG